MKNRVLVLLFIASTAMLTAISSRSGDLQDIEREIAINEEYLLPKANTNKVVVDIVYGGSILVPVKGKVEPSQVTEHLYKLGDSSCQVGGFDLHVTYDKDMVIRASISFLFQQGPERDNDGALTKIGVLTAISQAKIKLACLKNYIKRNKEVLEKAPWNHKGT